MYSNGCFFPFQSDIRSETGIELESQSADRLSDEKDNYFRDGKRKIGKLAILLVILQHCIYCLITNISTVKEDFFML